MIKKFLFLFICLGLVAFLVLLNYKPLDIREVSFTKTVEIKGEVVNPGIYEIDENMNLGTLIEKAGGLTKEADTRLIALSRKILHGDVIVIGEYKDKLISINSAPLEELVLIPGIGEKKAQLIIEYRSIHSFMVLEDLMNVKGIGEKSFEKMKDFICL